jgi:hypothetical protein
MDDKELAESILTKLSKDGGALWSISRNDLLPRSFAIDAYIDVTDEEADYLIRLGKENNEDQC